MNILKTYHPKYPTTYPPIYPPGILTLPGQSITYGQFINDIIINNIYRNVNKEYPTTGYLHKLGGISIIRPSTPQRPLNSNLFLPHSNHFTCLDVLYSNVYIFITNIILNIAPKAEYRLSIILSGCKQNDPVCQKALYERYYGYAASICMRYSASHDDALEIIDDGFLKIFKAINKFIAPADEISLQKVFMSWLKVIMINTCINYSKALARQISWTATEDHIHQISFEASGAVENLAYEDLVKLIQRLTPAYRNTFSLYVIEGFKHEEISKMLGISVGTSKSNLLKARKNLRKMLEQIHGEKLWNYER